jgi:hypothetical protein
VTVVGGTTVVAGAGAPGAIAAGDIPSSIPPKDGIDMDNRRNPATAKALLTTCPSIIPP